MRKPIMEFEEMRVSKSISVKRKHSDWIQESEINFSKFVSEIIEQCSIGNMDATLEQILENAKKTKQK